MRKDSLELAFLSTNDGLWDWNLKDNTNYFSKEWKNMLGYEEHELKNEFETWRKLIHVDDLENTLKDVQEHLDGKTEFYSNSHRLRHKDGSWVWVLARGKVQLDKDGNPDRFIGTHIDITKQRAKQLELETSVQIHLEEAKALEIQFKTIFEQTLDGIAILDLESNFLLANSAYQKMIGYSAEELKNKSCIKLTVHEMREKSIYAMQTTIKRGTYGGFEKRCIKKDRTEVDVIMDMVLMPNKENILAIVKDITLKKEYIKERENQEKLLLQQTRLAQMGEMIGNIAHQWRQPLNTLGLIIQKIGFYKSNGTLDDEKLEQSIDKSMKLINNMSSTIDDFREFFKPNKEKENFILHDVIHKAYALIDSELKDISVICEFTIEDKTSVDGYKNEFSQVILNIVTNSKDAFKGKNIKDPFINIRTSNDGENILIVVRDNAGGINEAYLDKIFNPYFTTKHQDEGTGIGLYMSKMIIEDHMNGKLTAENVADGASFSILLPNKVKNECKNNIK